MTFELVSTNIILNCLLKILIVEVFFSSNENSFEHQLYVYNKQIALAKFQENIRTTQTFMLHDRVDELIVVSSRGTE